MAFYQLLAKSPKRRSQGSDCPAGGVRPAGLLASAQVGGDRADQQPHLGERVSPPQHSQDRPGQTQAGPDTASGLLQAMPLHAQLPAERPP